VGPGAGLDRCGKSRPTGIRSPDLPARSESLYRLSYPGSSSMFKDDKFPLTLISIYNFTIYIPIKQQKDNNFINISYAYMFRPTLTIFRKVVKKGKTTD
jgi:hypothetical protein